MYTIYVQFMCHPEKREAFVEAVKNEGILDAVRAEDGCYRGRFGRNGAARIDLGD